MSGLGEMIEKLCIANIKLFNVCDEKADMAKNPGEYTKADMARVMSQDIELCKQRGKLKSAIDKLLMGSDAIEEIKNYGS